MEQRPGLDADSAMEAQSSRGKGAPKAAGDDASKEGCEEREDSEPARCGDAGACGLGTEDLHRRSRRRAPDQAR